MSRINKLENIYQEQLNHKVNNTSEFIQSIIDSDITKGKYARFLIESFLNDKFLEEDLIGGLNSTVGQAISLFHKHKSKLPINERSVYALDKETGKVLYQSPGDLWSSVKQYQGELSGKELKREEQEQIYRETEFVYKDEETGFQIISPLTEESAKWWGRGTRWCTSADNDNMFWDYAKDAPLFILLMPDNDKLQLWKNGNKIQFMDEADNEIELDYIEQNWSILEPICLWLNDLQFIPDELRTKELCESAVKQNGEALNYVPKEYKTIEMCEMAVQNNGETLNYVPDKFQTLKMYKIAVQQNGMALEYVPEKYKTIKLCELAVKQNGRAFKHIPKEYKTKELCELAVQQNGMALNYVPRKLRTKEICKIAIEQNGCIVYCIPENILTEELCELAVQQNGEALFYLPDELRTKELCELAVKQNGSALRYIPHEYKTPELCEMAVQNNGEALNYVPYQLKDELQHYVKNKVLELPIEKYKEIFYEIKTLFHKNDISLNIK